MVRYDEIHSIPLKVLVIDPDKRTAEALISVLRTTDVVISVTKVSVLERAADVLKETDVNTIYIDPIALDLEKASKFIFEIRRTYPAIVFVLYYDSAGQKRIRIGEEFYSGERQRFKHYFKLDKRTEPDFNNRVSQTIGSCQSDLSFLLTQEKVRSLQKELTSLRDAATTDTIGVPLKILKEIQEQLSARQQEAKASADLNKSAEFLGPRASHVENTRCFIIMPYAESWSEGVELILKRVCATTGIEFTIAKTMEGRFVAHDIWRGITGSGIVIADLTGANPNVTYEIGLADSLGKEVILICQNTKVPFDFLGHKLIIYENSVAGALKLEMQLSSRLTRAKEDLLQNGNH